MAKSRPTQPTARRTGELARTTEVFVRGFGFTRSFTHPYHGDRIGALWVLRDAPRKNPADYRREEWIASGTAPAAVDRLARANTRGSFCICAMVPAGEPEQPTRDAYKAIGYRLAASEPVMVHALKKIPRVKSPATIQRVLTVELAAAVAKAAGQQQILPEHLSKSKAKPTPLRLYAALIDGEVVGWVRSIVCDAGNWCSNMFVLPKYRRRGIATALLAQLLRDDRAGGAPQAVLTASHAGAKLYLTLGYQPIGTLLLFNPKQ